MRARISEPLVPSRPLPAVGSFCCASSEIDKGAQGRGQLSAARIVEIEARIIWAPIVKDTHQPACFDQIFDLSLKREGDPGAIQRRLHRQILFPEGELPIDCDG